MDRSPQSQLQTRPGIAVAEQGVVILDGPDGAAVTMTPEAAAATSASLMDAAATAQQQAADADEA